MITAAIGVGLAWAGAAWCGDGRAAGPASGNLAPKVLLVWTAPDHPYATHMYESECRLLARLLAQNGVDAVVSPEAEWPKDETVFEGVRSIVYYSRPAGDVVLSDAHAPKFRALMKEGVGYAAIHWGTCAWDGKYEKEYQRVLGGVFHPPRSGPKMGTSKLVQAEPGSDVCRGWKEYDLHDEFYMGMTFLEKTTQVLKVDVEGTEETVAWTYQRPDSEGGGRSFGCTLLHFHENMKIEAFRRAIVNGILWSAGLEVPEGGARVDVTEDDLRLPPEPARPGANAK